MGFYCKHQYVSDSEFKGTNVIKARDKYTGTEVALKRWEADCAEAENEIFVWKTLYSELFISTCSEDGYTYLIHKWIEGSPLSEYYLFGGEPNDTSIIELLIKICRALQNFYEKTGLVFCDLKPENIITDGEAVFLIDFESAKKASSGSEAFGYGESKTVHFASKAYSAPEIYHGEITYSADVYSLGMTALFLAAGAPRTALLGTLKGTIAEFCKKCICHDRELRIQTAAEAEAVLHTLLDLKERNQEKFNVFEVENMTVNAKKISYAEVYEEEKEVLHKQSHPAKVLAFPKNMIGYRRVILYIPENAAFASELAYMSAKIFGLKTAIFDLNKYYPERLRHYLFAEEEACSAEILTEKETVVADAAVHPQRQAVFNLNELLSADVSTWCENGLLSRCTGLNNLYMSDCNIIDELEADEDDLRYISAWCYSTFDITVFLGDFCIDMKKKLALMRISDYITVPVFSDIDSLVTIQKFFKSFLSENSIPLSKLRYVGWDYEKNESVEHELMVSSLGESIYLGTVGKDDRRRSVKNTKGSFYCEYVAPWLKAQYGGIINNLIFGDVKSA